MSKHTVGKSIFVAFKADGPCLSFFLSISVHPVYSSHLKLLTQPPLFPLIYTPLQAPSCMNIFYVCLKGYRFSLLENPAHTNTPRYTHTHTPSQPCSSPSTLLSPADRAGNESNSYLDSGLQRFKKANVIFYYPSFLKILMSV